MLVPRLSSGAVAALLLSHTALASLQDPTYTSKAPPAPTPIPGPNSMRAGNFEWPSSNPAFVRYEPTWGSWTFNAQTGIAAYDSSLLANNTLPPGAGTNDLNEELAFLEHGGVIEVSIAASPGTYRLQYSAAQKVANLPNAGQLRITLAGAIVAEDEDISETFQTLHSRPVYVSASGTITLRIEHAGHVNSMVFLDDIVLETVPEWRNAQSWVPTGGAPSGSWPSSLEAVDIEPGHVIALRGSCEAKTTDVAGELVVPNRSATLTTETLEVNGLDARFEVGRKGAPFRRQFTLNLDAPFDQNMDDPPGLDHPFQFDDAMSPPRHRGLLVRNGAELELHGRPVASWTGLLETVTAGATSILVGDTTGWRTGDEMILVGSQGQVPDRVDHPFLDLTERRTITSITPVPSQQGGDAAYRVGFVAPLERLHVGGLEVERSVHGAPLTLRVHSEVGLLTRNIVITSDAPGAETAQPPYESETAEPSDGANAGGHVMVMGSLADPTSPAGFARVSAVEFTRIGRSRALGRYPFHWHFVRAQGFGQYIEDCSMHDTFNRAIVVHGTDGVRVSRNISWRSLGHAMFLEDGSEIDNQITDNLVIFPRRPLQKNAILLSDRMPLDFQNGATSCYWITNPNNTIERNIAATSAGTGFWLIFPDRVTGQSIGQDGVPDSGHHRDMVPNEQPQGSFDGNVAHGCALGLDVHDGIDHSEDINGISAGAVRKSLEWLPPNESVEVLDGWTIYACITAIYGGVGPGTVRFERCVFADNQKTLFLGGYDQAQQCLFLADTETGMTTPPQPYDMDLEAYRVYDGAGGVYESRFEGFAGDRRRLIGHNRAADRHINHRFFLNEHYALGGSVQTAPDVEWLDFACHIQQGGVGTCLPELGEGHDGPEDPNSWGFVLHDDGTLFGSGASSVITNAPLLNIEGEVPYVSGSPFLSNANLTPRRYALVSISTPSDYRSLPPNDRKTRAMRVHRQDSPGGHPPVTADYPSSSSRSQQIPVAIEGSRFRYRVDMAPIALMTSADQGDYEFEVFQEDADAGWSSRVEIRSFTSLTGGLPVTVFHNDDDTVPVLPAAQISDLDLPVSETRYFIDSATGSLHIAFRQSSNRSMFNAMDEPNRNKREILQFDW